MMVEENQRHAPTVGSPRSDHRTRRTVLKRLLATALSLPFLGSLYAMVRGVEATRVPASISIPPDVPGGLSVVDSAIVHRDSGGTLRAFSASCTHLGCRIDRIIENEAVCPCHGSHFRADGTVSAGPARRPLVPLRIDPDPASGGWTARAT